MYPCRIDEFPAMSRDLREHLEDGDVPAEAREDLLLIAEEIFVNVVSYAHDDGEAHVIDMTLEVGEGSATLEFRDDGRPFDPLSQPPPDLDRPEEERRIGGLGIHLVRELSDRIRYAREGSMNILTVERSW
jgi:anti-sigma regulatory factor (Ser/Thr protein kinase)